MIFPLNSRERREKKMLSRVSSQSRLDFLFIHHFPPLSSSRTWCTPWKIKIFLVVVFIFPFRSRLLSLSPLMFLSFRHLRKWKKFFSRPGGWIILSRPLEFNFLHDCAQFVLCDLISRAEMLENFLTVSATHIAAIRVTRRYSIKIQSDMKVGIEWKLTYI